MTALIIAALIQLGVIANSSEYCDGLYQTHQAQVEIIIDDQLPN